MQPGPTRHVQIEAVGAPLDLELRSAGSLHEQPRRIHAADAHLASAARMNGAFVRPSEHRTHSRSAARVDRTQLRRLDGDRDPMFAAQAGVRFEPDVQRAILDVRLHQRKDLVIRLDVDGLARANLHGRADPGRDAHRAEFGDLPILAARQSSGGRQRDDRKSDCATRHLHLRGIVISSALWFHPFRSEFLDARGPRPYPARPEDWPNGSKTAC